MNKGFNLTICYHKNIFFFCKSVLYSFCSIYSGIVLLSPDYSDNEICSEGLLQSDIYLLPIIIRKIPSCELEILWKYS